MRKEGWIFVNPYAIRAPAREAYAVLAQLVEQLIRNQ